MVKMQLQNKQKVLNEQNFRIKNFISSGYH